MKTSLKRSAKVAQRTGVAKRPSPKSFRLDDVTLGMMARLLRKRNLANETNVIRFAIAESAEKHGCREGA